MRWGLGSVQAVTLCHAMGVLAQVFLNPPVELADMPLKSFYRYSLPDTTGAPPPVPCQ